MALNCLTFDHSRLLGGNLLLHLEPSYSKTVFLIRGNRPFICDRNIQLKKLDAKDVATLKEVEKKSSVRIGK